VSAANGGVIRIVMVMAPGGPFPVSRARRHCRAVAVALKYTRSPSGSGRSVYTYESTRYFCATFAEIEKSVEVVRLDALFHELLTSTRIAVLLSA